jgi:hypothetical protein
MLQWRKMGVVELWALSAQMVRVSLGASTPTIKGISDPATLEAIACTGSVL